MSTVTVSANKLEEIDIDINMLRIDYLRALQEIQLKNASTQLDINQRIKDTCNTIEQDLGIKRE